MLAGFKETTPDKKNEWTLESWHTLLKKERILRNQLGHREHTLKDQIGQKNVSSSLQKHIIFSGNSLSSSQTDSFIM